MVGKFQIAGVQIWLIAAGTGDATLQVVRHQHLRGGAKVIQHPDMTADPVGKALTPGGFGECVVRCAHHAYEDLCLPDFARMPVRYRHRLAGIIDKAFFAGQMFLAHHRIQFAGPFPVVMAEPAVTKPFRVIGLVLLPQQEQRDAFLVHFMMNPWPVGYGAQHIGECRPGRK